MAAHSTRRDFLKSLSLPAVAAAVPWASAAGPQPRFDRDTEVRPGRPGRGPTLNRPPLASSAFYPLPLTSVRPSGWLRRQLQIHANGLSGHLDEFWPDVDSNSGWLGGTGDSWERGPYFVDGLVPLAYLLQDERLIGKAQRWVGWTLDHPASNGMIGPASNDDWWPRMVMLKALTQYQEATDDPRVIPVLRNYFAYQGRRLPSSPLTDWGKYRWQDEVLSVLWLYNRTGDTGLLALAKTLQKQGYPWRKQFENFTYTRKTSRQALELSDDQMLRDIAMQTHGVNNAMGLKSSAVWWLLSKDPADREGLARQLRVLDRYHGIPNGMFSADEHYAGRNPSQGVELCAVVETMFSLEHGIAILGEANLADRLEQIAYNALPGTITADAWAHQYDQQPNQILCSLAPRPWSTNGPESNLFGLDPNFGCCTANMHQGWPKFAASLWMSDGKGGLAAVAYGPSRVSSLLAPDISVEIEEETDYPFTEEITLHLNPAPSSEFALHLRIPAWAQGAQVWVNHRPTGPCQAGTFVTITRRWKRGDRVDLRFPMRPRITRWDRNSIAVERGPLIFSLGLDEDWRKLSPRGMTADWEVYPRSAWNYGVNVNEQTVAHLKVQQTKTGGNPFAPNGVPVRIQVKGRRIPGWKTEENVAAEPPQSPVASVEPEETLALVPYAATKLRITAFPELESTRRKSGP
jgi:Beta-L-arabinofuranosidase, GH127 middle domain/Beta-L-arabinofuranosidase, GH127 catalytic domain